MPGFAMFDNLGNRVGGFNTKYREAKTGLSKESALPAKASNLLNKWICLPHRTPKNLGESLQSEPLCLRSSLMKPANK